MKKLRLELDALRVDSFRASPDVPGSAGTVLGRWNAVGVVTQPADPPGTKLSEGGETWCFDNGCTGDEQCTASTWTEAGICRTDRGCVETAHAHWEAEAFPVQG